MGWWAISGENGGIDFTSKQEGTPRDKVLVGGDGPADIMGGAVQEIAQLYKETWERCAKMEELRACFNFVTAPWVEEDGTFNPDREH